MIIALALGGKLSFNPMKDDLIAADGTKFKLQPPSIAPEVPKEGFKIPDGIFVAPPPDSTNIEVVIDRETGEIKIQKTLDIVDDIEDPARQITLSEEKKMSHIYLANEMDIIIIVPCTANFLSKIANGIADDLALNVLLASNKNKVIAPAMNTNMWENPIVKQNLRKLSENKFKILYPKSGKLACGMKGSGKLMDINKIIESINCLKGDGPNDLIELSLELGSKILLQSKKADNENEAKKKMLKTIDDGSALKKFEEMIIAQGGNFEQLQMSQSNIKNELYICSDKDGYISSMDTEKIGWALVEMGCGRQRDKDLLDYTAGIRFDVKVGETIKKGEKVYTLFGKNIKKLVSAKLMLNKTFKVSSETILKPKLILS